MELASKESLRHDYGSSNKVIRELSPKFGERLILSSAVRERFGKDESFHPSVPPDAVITPHSTDEADPAGRPKNAGQHRVKCSIMEAFLSARRNNLMWFNAI